LYPSTDPSGVTGPAYDRTDPAANLIAEEVRKPELAVSSISPPLPDVPLGCVPASARRWISPPTEFLNPPFAVTFTRPRLPFCAVRFRSAMADTSVPSSAVALMFVPFKPRKAEDETLLTLLILKLLRFTSVVAG
jgi:hypothetical protein